MAVNKFPILQRLVGLETEYAVRFHSTSRTPPSNYRVYKSVVRQISSQMVTAPAAHFKKGHFLANGGAVWFEQGPAQEENGLIEGATPECRGPQMVVQYQRAQDRMLGEAVRSCKLRGGQISLIKNDCDSRGNRYGAQENYEVQLALGWRLVAWRLGLLCMIPVMILNLIVNPLLIILFVVVLLGVYLLALLTPNPISRMLSFLKPLES